jgi:Cu(I)/Ag(I) efflux system membrane protein CusA/SilA
LRDLCNALQHRGSPVLCGLWQKDIEAAVIEGAIQRLRPKVMTVTAVLACLIPILWESGMGWDDMKSIAAPMVGSMITSKIHVLILVPFFFVFMKERALRAGTLGIKAGQE